MAFGVFRVSKLLRFAAVGALCYLTGLCLLYAGTEWLGLHYLLSMAIALVIVNALGWLANRSWTFGVPTSGTIHELLRYFAVNIGSMGMTLILMAGFVSWIGINYVVASAVTAVFMAIANFGLHSEWTFR